MAKPYDYVPRVNDLVLLEHNDSRLIVVHVDANRKTAAVQTIAAPVVLYENMPWSRLSPDECITPPEPN
jgi:hypothetical protein